MLYEVITRYANIKIWLEDADNMSRCLKNMLKAKGNYAFTVFLARDMIYKTKFGIDQIYFSFTKGETMEAIFQNFS